MPPNLYPKSLPDKFNFMQINPSKTFWKALEIPLDDLSSGLEFFTKLNEHNKT